MAAEIQHWAHCWLRHGNHKNIQDRSTLLNVYVILTSYIFSLLMDFLMAHWRLRWNHLWEMNYEMNYEIIYASSHHPHHAKWQLIWKLSCLESTMMPQVNFIPVKRLRMRDPRGLLVSQHSKPALLPFKAMTHGQELMLQHTAASVTGFQDWYTISHFLSYLLWLYIVHEEDKKKFGSNWLELWRSRVIDLGLLLCEQCLCGSLYCLPAKTVI